MILKLPSLYCRIDQISKYIVSNKSWVSGARLE